jgi:hypothetical protein
MKQIAVLVAVMLSLTLVAPAFAQPFADVPTDHWAYDAIAELAAKGLIEGYPDGAFRGDRAMTRYEMAMVVARLLARIEAIKIPPLPADLVRTAQLNSAVAAQTAATRAVDARVTALTTKLGTVQRLVAEFRAELAALGVRVTAVEEELAAIRARLDNTKIAGDMRFRYNVFPQGSVSGSGTFRSPDARLRARLTFTGRVASNVEATVRLWAANNPGLGGTTGDTRFGGHLWFDYVTFDLLNVRITNVLAGTWTIGRQNISIANHGHTGGLLFDPAGTAGAWTIAAGGLGPAVYYGTGSNTGPIDGVRGDWTVGPLNLTVGLFVDALPATFCTGNPAACNAPGQLHQVVRATTGALLPGWTLGGTYYKQTASPWVGAVFGGVGWGADIAGTLFPGVRVYVDYATWQPQAVPAGTSIGPSASAWRVGGNINLAQVAGIETWSPSLDLEYHNYGGLLAGLNPPRYTGANTWFGQYFPWDMRGWLARLNLTFSPTWSAFIVYEGGNVISSGAPYYEWWLRLTHRLAPNTTVYVQYTKANALTPGGGTAPFGGDIHNFYRAELSVSW